MLGVLSYSEVRPVTNRFVPQSLTNTNCNLSCHSAWFFQKVRLRLSRQSLSYINASLFCGLQFFMLVHWFTYQKFDSLATKALNKKECKSFSTLQIDRILFQFLNLKKSVKERSTFLCFGLRFTRAQYNHNIKTVSKTWEGRSISLRWKLELCVRDGKKALEELSYLDRNRTHLREENRGCDQSSLKMNASF